MLKNHLKKTFKLEGYILDKIEYLDDRILLHCHIQAKSMKYRGERSYKLNATRIRYLSHMMLEDKPVFLVVIQRRFYFSRHKTKLWEPLPGVSCRKKTTNTFRLNTLRELQRDNYKWTGKKRQRSGMFTSKLLDDLPVQFRWRKGITKLGLDGKGVRKHQLIHNVTNLEENKVIGVLPNFSQEELKNFTQRDF